MPLVPEPRNEEGAAPKIDAPPTAKKDPLDEAFTALASYDWGQDPKALQAIDEAIVLGHGDAARRKALEERLIAALAAEPPAAAKDAVCRRLSQFASASAVPALAAKLPDEKTAHMARYALERMPCPEALDALRQGLETVKGRALVGVIDSIGVRRDARSVARLTSLLADADLAVVSAAAAALGEISTSEAMAALAALRDKAGEPVRSVATDALLACAERSLQAGDAGAARKIYEMLQAPGEAGHVRAAARRGLSLLKPKG